MKKRRMKIWILITQTLLLSFLFCPVGTMTSGNNQENGLLNVFDLCDVTGASKMVADTFIYIAIACIIPAAIILATFLLKENHDCMIGIFGSVIYMVATAIFYTVASTKMREYGLALTGLHYLMVLLSVASLLFSIIKLLSADDDSENHSEKK